MQSRPMEPRPDSTIWFESGPEPLLNDVELATLMIRVGIISNSLAAQLAFARDAGQRQYSAAKIRDITWCFISISGLTYRGLELVQTQKGRLIPFAERGGAPPELIDEIKKLYNHRHEASEDLKRASNKVGFHWDVDVIAPFVRAFEDNPNLVWVESQGGEGNALHTLAAEVVNHVMFPEASTKFDLAEIEALVTRSLRSATEATQTLAGFFSRVLLGYLQSCNARPVRRSEE
jgi:hypothetical protein